jgi:N-acetylneuraminic acid mutarotase
LNDIWSLDVSDLLKGNGQTFKWMERKVKGNTFLTRWGHSSNVYDGKIYIFGGRFSNDLNDILVIDLEKSTMKALKTNVELPKARRRHSAFFVGSNLVIFGGFNGEYFNDLHYINVFELKKKSEIDPKQRTLSKANFEQFLNSEEYQDGVITSE